MKFTRSSVLPEIIIIEPAVFTDGRGHFLETYQAQRYLDHGIPAGLVQDNMCYSVQGVLRGLHYQVGSPQGKLVWVVRGEVFDVAVDIRKGSPTFGKWAGVTLSSDTYTQIYIPEGFAHGYCVTSKIAILAYKCTDYYAPEEERGIRWNDPSLEIKWPVQEPILSDKDGAYPTLENLPVTNLPTLVKNP